MADFNKKQYLDLAGLKAFWGIIKDKFVSEVSLTMGETGAVFTSKNGLGTETQIGVIPMATESQAGLMSAAQAKTVDEFSEGVAALVPLTAVKVNGTAAGLDGRAVNLDFIYNSDAKEIQVVDKNNSNAVLTKIDATSFIKDGMVSDVRLDGNNLVIEFNTDHGKEDIVLPLDKFIDVYEGTNGVKVEGKVISIVTNSDYLSADAAGLKVTDALWTEVGRLDTAVANAAAADAKTKAEAAQAAAEAKAAELANAAQQAGEAAAAQALADAKAYVDPKFQAIATEIGIKEGENAPSGLYKEIADAETAAKDYADDQIEAAIKAVVGEGGTLAGTLQAAKDYTDVEVTKVNTKIGAVTEGKDVVTMISDAETAAKAEAATLAGTAESNAKDHTDAEIAKLTASGTGILDQAKAYTDDEIAKINKEIEDNEKVTAESLTDLDDRVKVLEAVDHDKILQDAKDYADAKIGTLADGATTVAAAIANAQTDAQGYADTVAGQVYDAIEAIPVADITFEKLNA